MIKLLLIIPGIFLTTHLFAQEKPEGLFINSKAPDFKAIDQFGKEIRLKDVLRDSLVVLFFQWS